SGFLETAWKWLLKNHPHDSICGCSVDQVHEEMKTRFSWARSIGSTVMNDAIDRLKESSGSSATSTALVFNSTNASHSLMFTELPFPDDVKVDAIRLADGSIHPVQQLISKDDILLEATVGLKMAKMGLKFISGRKIMGYYINGIEYHEGDEPGLLEIQAIGDTVPVGEFDLDSWKELARDIIKTKKYSKFHVVASKPTQNVYAALLPLAPWGLTEVDILENTEETSTESGTWEYSKNHVENDHLLVNFNRDGSLNIMDKHTGLTYPRLHYFEDTGDKGDEYTYSHLGPDKIKVKARKRQLLSKGPVFVEIRQNYRLKVFSEINIERTKRKGKTSINVESTFKIYKNSPRVEITTKLINTAKDHRLRVCFNLPFSSATTRTSTHFGCITRHGSPEPMEGRDFAEHPSGIQAQKRYTRVDADAGYGGFTLFNKGLPEVELVGGLKLALTLIRSVGWLSRSDLPERPGHAGPGEETPGAQELGVDYEFKYGFVTHANETPLYETADHADAFAVPAITIPYMQSKPNSNLPGTLIHLGNPWIRISSMRVREGTVLVTLFNLDENGHEVPVTVERDISTIREILIDGTGKNEVKVMDVEAILHFEPHEIKMIQLFKQ
ncbi:hypothetical protein GF325_10515, partial [Candidatus Bathyarchaeota archaeon]|nr:hypothetical protein [Candidatus Bathyarchaeota archaeon]